MRRIFVGALDDRRFTLGAKPGHLVIRFYQHYCRTCGKQPGSQIILIREIGIGPNFPKAVSPGFYYDKGLGQQITKFAIL